MEKDYISVTKVQIRNWMFNEILSKLFKDEILEHDTNASFNNLVLSMCLVTHSKRSMWPSTQIFRFTRIIIPYKSGK
jgi:hypothetical protein